MHSTQAATGLTTIAGLNQLFATFPLPREIKIDNGSHFRNKEVQTWCASNGVRWTFHLPYQPQSNGTVERWNGLLKQLHKSESINASKWGSHL